MRVFEPKTITINPTNVCTAACRHCCMNSGPDRGDMMDWPQLSDILEQVFTELPEIRVIVFSGGESTLLGETLHRALRKIRAHGGVISRLVTNAYWATSTEAAHHVLKGLYDAGLDELNISTDDYHLPFISLQRVQRAFSAAQEYAFTTLAISTCEGPQSALTADRLEAHFGQAGFTRRFDEDGKRIPIVAKDGTAVVLSNCSVNSLGRGTEGVGEEETFQQGQSLFDYGRQAGGCVWAVQSASISATGRFTACCGFETEGNEILDYGDIATHGLALLLDRADNDIITNMIATIGPPRLKELLEQLCPDAVDFPRTDYGSYCEVCQDLTSIPANRQALIEHQGAFVNAVLRMRQAYRDEFTDDDGKVRIPPSTRLLVNYHFKGREGPPSHELVGSALAPEPS